MAGTLPTGTQRDDWTKRTSGWSGSGVEKTTRPSAVG
jgi:hypothetical protein